MSLGSKGCARVCNNEGRQCVASGMVGTYSLIPWPILSFQCGIICFSACNTEKLEVHWGCIGIEDGESWGASVYNCMWKFLDHTHFPLKSHPFGVDSIARPLWQEFLSCSNEETNCRSEQTLFIKFYISHSQDALLKLTIRPCSRVDSFSRIIFNSYRALIHV